MTARILAIGFSLLITGCLNPIASVTRTAKPLSYVGNIYFGTPTVKRNYLIIPLQYTEGEWLMNSALSAYHVDVRVIGRSIEFTVVVAALGADRSEAGYQLMLPASIKGESENRVRPWGLGLDRVLELNPNAQGLTPFFVLRFLFLRVTHVRIIPGYDPE